MHIIVPLAGPDFELPDGTTRAERVVEGLPLLRLALESRSWWLSGDAKPGDMVFIMRDTPVSRRFAQDALQSWYPGARAIFLGDYTGGAALTALAGIALCGDGAPICIDLADIVFEDEAAPLVDFQPPLLGGMLLTFQSSDPAYSYAACNGEGWVVRTCEKRVISDRASAGVYFFRDAQTLLRAIAHSLEHRDEVAYNGLLYVCPLYNGVIANGGKVITHSVKNVRDIKQM